jgi:hypothetical protein
MKTNQEFGTIDRLFAERNGTDTEAIRAKLAGQDLGQEDRDSGIFDDSAPASITGDYVTIYQTAYREINPATQNLSS